MFRMIEVLRRSYEFWLMTEGTNRLTPKHLLLAVRLQSCGR